MKIITGLAAVALAATTLAPPASAAPAVPPTDLAADWITGQLSNGLAVGEWGADPGLSIDAGLALEALGRSDGAGAVADAIGSLLVTSADVPYGYVRSAEGGSVGKYANATAKAAAFTTRVERDPRTAYDAIDLIAQLEELTDDTTGRIADASTYGNYANTIGQAFAVEALTAAGSPEAAAATDVLVARQCPGGFFPLSLSAACPNADAVIGPDITALAVISLVRSGRTSPDVTSAVAAATGWLESTQRPDGSFANDLGSNANSTGLAAWALGEAGRAASAARAAAWTRSMQVADAGACAGQAPTGAIAFTPADLAEARTDGLGTKRDSWRRATFQAAPALVRAPSRTMTPAIATPAGAAGGSTITATVTGLAAGEQGCVALDGAGQRVVGTGSDVQVSFDLPAGPGTYTSSLTTLDGTWTSTTTVAAPVPAPAPTMPTPTTPAPTPTGPTAPTPTTPTESAAPATGVGRLRASDVERVTDGAVRLAVRCDAANGCAGRLVVRTRRPVDLTAGRTRKLVVGATRYSVVFGGSEVVVLDVRRRALAALRRSDLPVVATQVVAGAPPVRTEFRLWRP